MAQQYRFEISAHGPELATTDLEDIELGALGDADVLIDVEAAAISPLEISPGRGPAVVLGSAAIGVVTAAGSAATAFVGKRVLTPAIQPCGECDSCRRAVPSGCANAVVLGEDGRGAVAEQLISRARWLIALTDKLEPLQTSAAILGGDGLRAYSAYCRAGVAPGEPVVVLGSGTASDILAELGASLGAKITRVTNTVELESLSSSLSSSSLSSSSSSSPSSKPWHVFALDRFDGVTVTTICEALSPGSTLVVGNPNAISELGIVAMCERGVTVIGQRWGHPDLLGELAALVAKGDLDLGGSASAIALTMIAASDLSATLIAENAEHGRTTIATF